jgi:hypothetical protein
VYKFGHYLKEESKIVQTYVDNVLLFARSRECLEKVLMIVEEFLESTKIELKPGNCTAFNSQLRSFV